MIKHILLIAVMAASLAGCGESQEQKQASRAEVAWKKLQAEQEAVHQKNQADLREYARRHGGK